MGVHDGQTRHVPDASSSDNQHHDNENDSDYLNPFAPPTSGNIRNRRSPMSSTTTNESSTLMSEDRFHSNSTFSDTLPSRRFPDEQVHFLEFESSPSRSTTTMNTRHTMRVPEDDDLLGTGLEPMQTQSGLLLTHRQTPLKKKAATHKAPAAAYPSRDRIPPKKTMEMDWGYYNDDDSAQYNKHAVTLERAKKMLSLAKVWIVAFCLILVIGTGAIWHSSHYETSRTEIKYMKAASTSHSSANAVQQKIIIVPRPPWLNTTQYQATRGLQVPAAELSEATSPPKGFAKKSKKPTGVRRVLQDIRQEFDDWVVTHEIRYHSHDEKEKRFHIWSQNHEKTQLKNERHGPCKMTKQPVFGSNLFKDLTPEEFQSRYLTGYHGPKTDELQGLKNTAQQHAHHTKMRQTSPGSGMVLDAEKRGGPLHAIKRHEKVQQKFEAKLKEDHHRKLGYKGQASYSSSSSSCVWYDVSCWLRLFVNEYGFRIGGTMEPAYDSDSYPSAVDWRDMGVVSSIHSQGNCGACWAITGVETIESAYAIATGTLVDLAETEVIICDDTCDMCEGGWPQNAYEYTMDKGGLPLEDNMSYDGDYLLALTYAKNGESDTYGSDYYTSAVQNTCPAGGNSNDNGSNSRYGNIKGYGYTTDRCICYTDGTGCDCDEQNENLAVMNVATYGPATVCLEASLWQDYSGGIITSELGCSSAFLDMNHCVQAVGYAYVNSSGDEEENDKSGSGSNDSKDDGDREGYWIIRNQWSRNWGMYGYAYVAMGDNTCGVLNDMTHAYMD
jgi:C1A family cysteine protease